MKPLLILLLAMAGSFYTKPIAAQTQDSVQFSFWAQRLPDSTVKLAIVAKKATTLLIAALGNDSAALASQLTIAGKPVDLSKVSYSYNKLIDKHFEGLGNAYFFKSSDTVYVRTAEKGLRLKGNFTWLANEGDAFPTGSQEFNVPVEELSAAKAASAVVAGNATDQSRPLASTIFWSFMAGLAAVFTPCVFPLITVTVSYFLKRNLVNQADKKAPISRWGGISQAVTYSLSIILIYTIPTLVLTLIFGEGALYNISTSPISNLLFFAIFVFFGLSFFGAYELTLPSGWASKTDSAASKGGYLGIFFMALTLVIVSFSCTGPIVGSLLSQTSSQGIALAPVLGILAFSVGLALPFTLLALFPHLMQRMPRSGGWLNSVKVVFGFLELALALKFLSNVDLMYHWGLLNRDVFLSIWIVLAVLMGLYLLGKLKFSHDEDLAYIPVPRLLLAIASFSFAVFLVPGLWGAPIRSLSGLLPPATTQSFDLHTQKVQNAAPVQATGHAQAPAAVKHTDILKLPLGLSGYFDLAEAKAASSITGKPILIDFTGHSCANCRKMEEEVWARPEVKTMLANDFILLSLYVDERRPLPDAEVYTNAAGQLIETIGEKNLDYEKTKFGVNAQPLYMFIDHQENVLSPVLYGYDSDAAKFVQHLQAVKAAHQKMKTGN